MAILMARTARQRKRPEKDTLATYKDRVVMVQGAARGQRSMIEWVDEAGKVHRTAVKVKNLTPLGEQLF
ncbi:hypothetical protein [Burkholderia gladioli]|uniref:hypothetical protein n=2 Tax=Burkholderia TaxID=32008 RepID=UPI001FC809B1|nr:hypothetical protein [Burkholderia gladioli]